MLKGVLLLAGKMPQEEKRDPKQANLKEQTQSLIIIIKLIFI